MQGWHKKWGCIFSEQYVLSGRQLLKIMQTKDHHGVLSNTKLDMIKIRPYQIDYMFHRQAELQNNVDPDGREKKKIKNESH